jgi:hypothetical protein
MSTEHINAAGSSFCRLSSGGLHTLCTIGLIVGLLVIGACHDSDSEVSEESEVTEVKPVAPAAEPAPSEPTAPAEPLVAESSLFDGKTLGHWQITDFGGQGDVYVKDGSIYLDMGNDMTGITWGAPLPFKTDYEITLEAMRVDGSDFFCGLTFPVGEKFCSLVLGGWGGTLCGLSNIDYYDAANNETTRIVSFENGKWYHVCLHVKANRIQAWLKEEGEEPLVDMDITDRKIDTRAEMDSCQPMGVATWQTSGAVRNIHMRKLVD